MAKKLTIDHLDTRLIELEASLLAATSMGPDSIRLLDEMCRNDVSLDGTDLLIAAEVAKTATR